MRIGVFISAAWGGRTTAGELLANASEAERLGLASAWVPHVPWSFDALTALALAATATTTIDLGTAVVPTYSRHPLAMAQQALSIESVAPGRVVLGLGPSHQNVIETHYGLSYARPLAHTREYLDVLDSAFDGADRVDHDGERFSVHAPLTIPGATSTRLMLAALAPGMLALAGRRTEGTITWMCDERSLADHVVPILSDAATAAGRPAPRVVMGLPVALTGDADAGRAAAARRFAVYRDIPTYQRILDRGDHDDPTDVVVVGDEALVERRLRSLADAGGTELAAAVFPVGDGPERDAGLRRTVEFLADLHRRW